jgi:hypothetical protein
LLLLTTLMLLLLLLLLLYIVKLRNLHTVTAAAAVTAVALAGNWQVVSCKLLSWQLLLQLLGVHGASW